MLALHCDVAPLPGNAGVVGRCVVHASVAVSPQRLQGVDAQNGTGEGAEAVPFQVEFFQACAVDDTVGQTGEAVVVCAEKFQFR